MCRYGQPELIRSDNGTEFQGAFRSMCEGLVVEHTTSGAHHPRAMGQVERMNRSVNGLIVQALLGNPATAWWEWVPDIAMILRMTAARSHGFTPYFLVYKSHPRIPGLQEYPRALDIDLDCPPDELAAVIAVKLQ